MKKKKVILFSLLAAICIFVIGIFAYVGDYYHADAYAQEIMQQQIQQFSILETSNKEICFIPEQPVAGLIFYPGGKVEYTAYAPLMSELAENGILCVLLHMPGNLAMFDQNAADGVIAKYSYIDNWYMAGHSLGGAMAANYVSKHTADFEGLILLASYSVKDLNESDLSVLSLYGTEDLVLNKENYEKNLINMPKKDFTEYIIQGGCHAYFGNYGFQDGDGTPSISNIEQVEITANTISQWIHEKEANK